MICRSVNKETDLSLCTIKESDSGKIYSVLPLPTTYIEPIIKETLMYITEYGRKRLPNIGKIEFETI